MATISTTYIGDLKTEAIHLQSGSKLITDAPTDNHGKGEGFSPTDLLAESLAGCVLTVMALAARSHGINMDNTKCDVSKVMAPNPRRVAEIILDFKFPMEYTDQEKKILELAASTCPVSVSLHPDLKKTINFGW
jgi:putative redox protein